jgi:ornithine--oxo-acid transaminase
VVTLPLTYIGRGLLNAIIIDEKSPKTAWHICLLLKHYGILAKPTHGHIIRLAPPLVITKVQLQTAVDIIAKVFVLIETIDVMDIPGINE